VAGPEAKPDDTSPDDAGALEPAVILEEPEVPEGESPDAAAAERDEPAPTAAEDPTTEDPAAEEPAAEEPTAEEPTTEDAAADDAVAEAQIAPGPAPVAPAQRGSVLPLIAGGILAGAVGVGAGYFMGTAGSGATDTAVADRLAAIEAAAADRDARVTVLEGQSGAAADAFGMATSEIATLSDRLDTVEARVTGLTPTDSGVSQDALDQLRAAAMGPADALAARLDGIAARLDQAETSLADLGSAPAQAPALDDYAADLAALQEQIAAQSQAIAEAEASARAITDATARQQRAATARSALNRLVAAIEGGGPYSAALSQLTGASDVTIPAVLGDNAAAGVASLTQLQRRFPAAARAGLDAAIRATAGDGTTLERVTDFLRTQTGARSLEERAGDDPDAVLSRAEARLAEGNLPAALAEVDSLPLVATDAMADWIAAARTRTDATRAAAALAAALDQQ